MPNSSETMDEEKFLDFSNRASIHSDIIYRTGCLLLMFSITEKKLDEFSDQIPWYDENDSRSSNKHRMKETGSIINGYNKNLRELTIIGLAKIFEDLIFDIQDKLKITIDFWKNCDDFSFYEEMKIIRHLNNCIKHNRGTIIKGSRSSNYLINRAGFSEYADISDLNLDIEKIIMHSFTFQMDMFWKIYEKENRYLGIKDDFISIRKILIPEYIT